MQRILSFILNIALVYALYMVCRLVYVWEFWDLYSDALPSLSLRNLIIGSFRFDTAAICYTNILYALLICLPLPQRLKQTRTYGLTAKIIYVVVNAVMLTLNLADTVYSRYSSRRTTWTFFSEFQAEDNLLSIFGIEVLNHWYLVLLGIAFILALVYGYRPIRYLNTHRPAWAHYTAHTIATICIVGISIVGIRGGVSTAIRPIAISNANQYVSQPEQAAIVLNTPFTLIRTCGKTTFTDPGYFTPQQLDHIYTPIHQPDTTLALTPGANVVVLIVESFGTEYWGCFNNYPGHTPFLDSLAAQSLTFSHAYANGRKSIDAMPSILSSIPMFVEPFFVTGYSLNNVGGLADCLNRMGYTTAFFHGAENGSMGFQAFARTSGFQHYYGRTEYEADPTTGGSSDFDGTWAIWDEEFLQFYAKQLGNLTQPFCTALFTASSHHPFTVPQRYRQQLHQPGHPIYTCVRYTDQALRQFFHTASSQPWFRNTLFVITADHTNHSERPEYHTPLGTFRVPILIYDPSGRIPRGTSPVVAQQTDIMPTLLTLLGCPTPYVAFGKDLLSTPPEQAWAINYNNGLYQYRCADTLIQHDGQHLVGLYHLDTDPACNHNLATTHPAPACLAHLQAIVQSYMQRMVNNQLTVEPNNNE